jgi:hypothetical protein
MKFVLIILVMILCASCSSANLDDVKNNADKTFEQAGFQIIGYEGYNLGLATFGTSYGGAYVWYTLKNKNDGIIYEAAIQRWGNEYHIYDLKALNAISNK